MTIYNLKGLRVLGELKMAQIANIDVFERELASEPKGRIFGSLSNNNFLSQNLLHPAIYSL